MPDWLAVCAGAGPLVDADAPPAIAKDTPAIPNAGTALLGRFRFGECFARDMMVSSHTLEPTFDEWTLTITLSRAARKPPAAVRPHP